MLMVLGAGPVSGLLAVACVRYPRFAQYRCNDTDDVQQMELVEMASGMFLTGQKNPQVPKWPLVCPRTPTMQSPRILPVNSLLVLGQKPVTFLPDGTSEVVIYRNPTSESHKDDASS